MFELDDQAWLMIATAGAAVVFLLLMAVLLLNRAGRAATKELERRRESGR